MLANQARAHSISASLLFAALFLTGCIDNFGARTAYEDQRFLCDEEHEETWNEEIATCTELFEDEDCAGVISLQGMLESQAITLETRFVDSAFKITEGSFGIFDLTTVDAVGPTPYFTLSFKLDSVGATVETDRVLDIDQGAKSKDNDLNDEFVSASLRLTSGGDSVSLGGRTGSGQIHVDRQEFVQIRGTFDGDFGGEDDHVEGCFFIKPIESFLTIE